VERLKIFCLAVCQADLNSFPLGELEETAGMPPYYVDEDYPAGPEINSISSASEVMSFMT